MWILWFKLLPTYVDISILFLQHASVIYLFIYLLTPEPNGVGEGVYGIGRVLRRRRRRHRRRDTVSVWTP